MKLIIVESPSKAKTIQGYAGADYKVVACYGHITDLAKGGNQGIGIDINNDFKPKYVLMDDKVSVLESIMKEAEKCDEILLAQDRDREGENIAWQLQTRLEDFNKPIYRIEFGEITKKGFQDGIKNVRSINMNTCRAAEARRILDRVVGFMASPFLMNTFGQTLSAGRVQSVVTKMVVDREREIEQFIPEEYWVIQAKLTTQDNFIFSAKYDKKVSSSEEAMKIKAILEGSNLDASYIVQSVISSKEKKKPSPPLITGKLQQIMSKQGMIPEKTMKIAQSLYEKGYITYIRTDSIRVSEDAIQAARKFLKENSFPIPKTPNEFKNKDEAQDAHECIRPTELDTPPDSPEFSQDEREVYEVIWRNFLASQSTPAVYATLKVSIALKDNIKYVLKCSGKCLEDEGFLKILNVKDNSKIDIPSLIKGQELSLSGKTPITADQKFTQPPGRYSNATILKSLEDKEIGRPATYAELLSKITSRNYVILNSNVFHPTDLGKKVCDELSKFFSFMDYDYSSLMEKQLDLIETSKINQLTMLKDFFEPFKKELNKAYADHNFKLCEKCDSAMIPRVSKKGESYESCSNWPYCRNTKSIAS